MTWREFAEISKTTFVEVALEEYGIQGRPTNQSRVAILTGLSRREVKKQKEILSSPEPPEPRTWQPATRVLSGWHQDPDFLDAEGRPRELDFDGPGNTFMELLRRYSGDLPAGAMIKELERVKAIERQDEKTVRVLSRVYLPPEFSEENLRWFGIDLHDLAATMVHNITNRRRKPWFRRVVENEHIPPEAVEGFHKVVAAEGQKLLETLDAHLSSHEVPAELRAVKPTLRTGVGIYFFKD